MENNINGLLIYSQGVILILYNANNNKNKFQNISKIVKSLWQKCLSTLKFLVKKRIVIVKVLSIMFVSSWCELKYHGKLLFTNFNLTQEHAFT